MGRYGARMRYLLYFLIFLLCGCSSFNSNNIQESRINLFGVHSIKFEGSTSLVNANLFEKILSNNPKSIDTLIISSRGGDVFGGMHIGRLVNEYGLKVIVRKVCASSCASYIVTASSEVIIEEGAILGWHGGATQTIYSPLENTTSLFNKIITFFVGNNEEKIINDFIDKWQNEEINFFEMAGVSQTITILGMMPGLKEQRNSMLFSYDTLTLRRLGLKAKFEGGEQSQLSKDGTKFVQIFKLSKEKLNSLLNLHNKLIKKGKNS